jgi:hypothetical protein
VSGLGLAPSFRLVCIAQGPRSSRPLAEGEVSEAPCHCESSMSHAHFVPHTAVEAAGAGQRWHGLDLRLSSPTKLHLARRGRRSTWGATYWDTPTERVAEMDRRGIGRRRPTGCGSPT